MDIDTVVTHLRDHVPLLQRRVGAGFDVEAIDASVQLSLPCASVIFAGDDAGHNELKTGVMQRVTDELHVLVVVDNPDERGQQAVARIGGLRRQLLCALAGWTPAEDYLPVEYLGSDLVRLQRGRLLYLFKFSAEWQLGGPDASPDAPEVWPDVEAAQRPDFTGLDVRVDYIDPGHGPDGQIEHHIAVDLPPPTP